MNSGPRSASPNADGRPAATALLSREGELDRLRRFFGQDGSPCCTVIIGDPGIGKTAVWDAALELASELGYATLSTRSSESEAGLAFAALADLVEDLSPSIVARLPAPQRQAIEVAVRTADAPGTPPDPLAIAAGFLGAIRIGAAAEPTVLAFDDLQWLDSSSTEPLLFAVRRLPSSVRFLLSRRPGPPPALERALQPAGVEHLPLSGLSLGAIRHLLLQRLDFAPPRRVLRQLFDVSQGNPLFALELGRLVVEGNLPGIGDELPFPHLVEEVFGQRVQALSEPTRRALLAVSLSADLDMDEISKLIDGVELDDALRSGVLVRERSGLRPSHPLLGAAARHYATARQRQDLHHALAQVVRDPVLRARHLAMSTFEADAVVAAEVAAASDLAAEQGAVQEAEELSDHALRLTPAGSPERCARIMTLAQRHLAVGDLPRAENLLADHIGEFPPGAARARAHLLLGESTSIPGESTQLALALQEAGDDPEVRVLALTRRVLIMSASRVERLEEAERWAVEALAAARAAGGGLEWKVLPGLAWTKALRGCAVEGAIPATELPRGSTLEEAIDRPAAVRAAFRGEIAKARAGFSAILDAAQLRGELRPELSMRIHLGELELRAGNVAQADMHLDELDQWGSLQEMVFVSARLRAVRAAIVGDPAAARTLIARTLAAPEDAVPVWDRLEVHRAEGVAALCELDFVRAVDRLKHVWDHTQREGVNEPGAFPVAGDLVEAMVLSNDEAGASAVADRLAVATQEQDHPWGRATTQRCRGILRFERGYHDDAVACLAAAADAYRTLGLHFDAARSSLILGRALRRSKKRSAARSALEEAAAEFERHGSSGWAEQARQELLRISGRRPGAQDELTASERRVAELASQGLSNKEIAGQLVVSVHTVEEHLSNAYAKLGIRSRGQLAGRINAMTSEDALSGD